MRTVKDLITLLSVLPESAVVVLSKDGEGNQYSPWAGDFSAGVYLPDSTWSGDFISYDDEEGIADYVDEDTDCDSAIVLWPIN